MTKSGNTQLARDLRWRWRRFKRKKSIRVIFGIPIEECVEKCSECQSELELIEGCWHCKNCGFSKS